jgi:putative flippase GtrA
MTVIAAPRHRSLWPLLRQMARFGLVGASNTIITLMVYALLVRALPAVVAALVAWAAGAANGYRLNRGWTFASRARGARPAARYLCVQGAGAGLDAALVWLLIAAAGASHLAGEAGALPIASAATFALCRWWVFA